MVQLKQWNYFNINTISQNSGRKQRSTLAIIKSVKYIKSIGISYRVYLNPFPLLISYSDITP